MAVYDVVYINEKDVFFITGDIDSVQESQEKGSSKKFDLVSYCLQSSKVRDS